MFWRSQLTLLVNTLDQTRRNSLKHPSHTHTPHIPLGLSDLLQCPLPPVFIHHMRDSDVPLLPFGRMYRKTGSRVPSPLAHTPCSHLRQQLYENPARVCPLGRVHVDKHDGSVQNTPDGLQWSPWGRSRDVRTGRVQTNQVRTRWGS